MVNCERCKKDLSSEDEFGCTECEETYCEDCIIMFKNIGDVCKSCIDEAYPREIHNAYPIQVSNTSNQDTTDTLWEPTVKEKDIIVPTKPTKKMGFSEPIL